MARPKQKPETLRKNIAITLDPVTIEKLELYREQTSIPISKIVELSVELWLANKNESRITKTLRR